MSENAATTGQRPALSAVDIVRSVVMVVAILTLVLWGALGFAFPWNIVAAIVAPALAILVWALFVSPKAVFRVHPFVRAFAELLVFATATIAWWDMDQSVIGIAFGVVAVATGLVTGRRSIA